MHNTTSVLVSGYYSDSYNINITIDGVSWSSHYTPCGHEYVRKNGVDVTTEEEIDFFWKCANQARIKHYMQQLENVATDIIAGLQFGIESYEDLNLFDLTCQELALDSVETFDDYVMSHLSLATAC